MRVSAPSALARAATSASLRTLLPPKPNGIASSRLTRRRGPPPSAVESRSIGSTSGGRGSNGSDGSRASAARNSAEVIGMYITCKLDLLAALRTQPSVIAAELRPPRAELAHHEGMDAWIDTYHAVR